MGQERGFSGLTWVEELAQSMLQAGTPGPGFVQPLKERLAAHNGMRVMGSIATGEVDVGPLLGRGAFGRVYKGRQACKHGPFTAAEQCSCAVVPQPQ